MEFGVGAVALLLLDVVLLGLVFPQVERLVRSPGRGVVTVRLTGSEEPAAHET
jgi:hypothetical protein